MSELLTGFCPNCGNKLRYEAGKGTVTCNACDSTLRIEDITAKSSSSIDKPAIPSFVGFDNPESGVVFLENFFDTYDWDTYQQSPEILIPEISEVIGNNKVKNGAVPETWYLDFMGLYIPVSKKFESLGAREKEIVEKFNPVDPTDILTAFDTYRLIARELLNEKDAINKALAAAVKYAERFSLKADRLSEMKKCLAGLDAKFATLATKTVTLKGGETKTVVVDKIEDLPAYEVAKRSYSAKSAAEFSARGIDAQSVYNEAVEAFKAGDNARALQLFESVRAYSDSARYIKKLNQYFNFFGEVYRINDKHFVYKLELYKESVIPVLNLKGCAPGKKKKAAEANAAAEAEAEASATLALSLYAVEDGKVAKDPTVKGMDAIIATYGTKIFFFKTKKGIACYDLATGAETIIDSGDPDLYKNGSGKIECGKAEHAPVFYIKKRYKETVTSLIGGGCLKKKQTNTEVKVNELNPYTLLLVDMSTCSCRTIVSEMVDIKLRKEDKIFYSFAYKTDAPKPPRGCFGKKAPVQEAKTKSRLMVCDLDKGTTTQVLDDDCDIHEVHGDSIIYSLWKPNDLNEDLHVYNIETREDVLIEDNVYEYFDLIDGKVYYTIGNSTFRPLVRANLDGSEREQVMRNVKKIEFVRGGWFYVTKGSGVNSVLAKIKVDGSETVVLCTGIRNINRFEGNLIYYVDVYNDLRAVRIDGKENRLIVEGIEKVFPAEDGLYYCRKERVGDRDNGLSLYHMDKDGKNIKKVIFNVDRVQDDDVANMLYYSKAENVRYKVYEQGKEDESRYEYYDVVKYYRIKKSESGLPAGAPELYLVTGAPENITVGEEPKGCLAKLLKKKPVTTIREEAPIVHSYKTRGLSDAEIVAQEEEEKAVNEAVENKLPSWLPASLKTKVASMASKNSSGTNAQGCQGCAPKKA